MVGDCDMVGLSFEGFVFLFLFAFLFYFSGGFVCLFGVFHEIAGDG